MKGLLFLALATGPFFVDEADRAGLTGIFVCGDEHQKNYVVETLGTGAAFLDFDSDGLLDIFAVTASKLEKAAADGGSQHPNAISVYELCTSLWCAATASPFRLRLTNNS